MVLYFLSVPKYKWAENDMSAAVTAVNNGMSERKAAEEFAVPKSTLSDRVTGRVKPSSISYIETFG